MLGACEAHASLLCFTGRRAASASTAAGLRWRAWPRRARCGRDRLITKGSAAQYTETRKDNGVASKKHTAQEKPTEAVGHESFAWLKNWYPLEKLSNLDATKPSALVLLNINIVVWRDGQGNWGASEDRCPHRLAPLSEGRVQDGNLACNYHGWQFDRKGNCLQNPQSGQTAADPACRSDRAKARAFPTQVAQGLLWVWPESGPHAWLESAMQSPNIVPELTDPAWKGTEASMMSIVNMVNWDIMMENTMDPSHANWLHDGFVGKWEDAAVMTMRLTDNPPDPKQGFTVEHNGYSKTQQAAKLQVWRNFTPPCTVRHEYHYSFGMKMLLAFYFVPTTPGKTKILGGFLFQKPGKPSFQDKLLAKIPGGIKHNLFGGRMDDQDAIMLHNQDHALRRESKHWRSYYVPSSADMAVVTFRRWLNEKGGGDVGWTGGVSSSDLPPKFTREQLRSTWDRHTKDCSECKQAIAVINKVRTGLTVTSAALLLLALFTTAQYRSYITAGTLTELGLGVALLVARQALANFQRGYYVSTGPVYDFREKPKTLAEKADPNATAEV